MSSKLKEKNGFQRKREIHDKDFSSILNYLRRKIFISFSIFKESNDSTNLQTLTEEHINQLKKELE